MTNNKPVPLAIEDSYQNTPKASSSTLQSPCCSFKQRNVPTPTTEAQPADHPDLRPITMKHNSFLFIFALMGSINACKSHKGVVAWTVLCCRDTGDTVL
ncbi:uncharacterized protein PgNI_02352 [Pyricularia grisea]|uniref:Uncharacterized protein n=1 Tax=Pyricularia grisea TaxID=148305 RepID=A0A6P8BJ85_PYRGI|nr:uncharacterized protein PgNI_02352 [Pyricularia grisea]TLD16642.1 hypothetical protein PgNI_02352 [Pyricularia grisea]